MLDSIIRTFTESILLITQLFPIFTFLFLLTVISYVGYYRRIPKSIIEIFVWNIAQLFELYDSIRLYLRKFLRC